MSWKEFRFHAKNALLKFSARLALVLFIICYFSMEGIKDCEYLIPYILIGGISLIWLTLYVIANAERFN